jgi:hypothetical protein
MERNQDRIAMSSRARCSKDHGAGAAWAANADGSGAAVENGSLPANWDWGPGTPQHGLSLIAP